MMLSLKKEGGSDIDALRKKADQAVATLRGGADFATVARSVSEGGKAANGGDWGWVDPALFRSQLAEKMKSLPIGTISDVMDTPDTLYIMKVADRKDAAVKPFTEVQSEIEQKLRGKLAKGVYDSWIESLKDTAYIKLSTVKPF